MFCTDIDIIDFYIPAPDQSLRAPIRISKYFLRSAGGLSVGINSFYLLFNSLNFDIANTRPISC
jgi:hypothetical protein